MLYCFSDEVQEDEDAEARENRSSNRNDYGSIEDKTEEDDPTVTFSTSWKINGILAIICCWFAMALTSWGSIQRNGSIANPQAGRVSMWLVIASQWLIILLYLWTLAAPKSEFTSQL